MFCIPVLPVVDSLAPNAESVEANVSYNKIFGWSSQGRCIRGSVEGSLSYFSLLRELLASFCLLTKINIKITCRYKQRNLSLHRCQFIFSINIHNLRDAFNNRSVQNFPRKLCKGKHTNVLFSYLSCTFIYYAWHVHAILNYKFNVNQGSTVYSPLWHSVNNFFSLSNKLYLKIEANCVVLVLNPK